MSGIFNASIFNNAAFNTGASIVVDDVVKTGTGGIDPGKKHKGIVKPLGTLGLPRKAKQAVDARIQDAKVQQAEIASRLAKEFSVDMTMEEVHSEIGTLLRKTIRNQEEDAILILLMMAAAI